MGSDWARYRGREIPASLKLCPVFGDHFRPEDRILDLGCGYGRTGKELLERGFDSYLGLDLNLSGLKEGRSWLGRIFPERPRPGFLAGEGAFLPFSDAAFDGLVMQAFLTTQPREGQRKAVAQEAARVLAPGGRIYVADFALNRDNPLYLRRYREGREMGLEPGAFPVRDQETGATLFTARHFADRELPELFQRVGLALLHHSNPPFTTWTGKRVRGQLLVLAKS